MIRRYAMPLLLALMWVFGTYHGGSAALVRFQDRATVVDLVQPAQPVIVALQRERRLTALVLAGATDRHPLAAQWAGTDRAVADLRRSADRLRARWSGAPARATADALLDRLTTLPATRIGAENRSLDRQRVMAAYSEAVDAALRLSAMGWPRTDPVAVDRQAALADLARAGELLAREDALVSGASFGLTEVDRAALGRLASARRLLHADAVAGLAARDRARLAGMPDSGVDVAEDALLRRTGTPDVTTWRAAVDPALAAVHEVVASGVRDGAAASAPSGVWVVTQAGIFGGLGLVTVLTAYVVFRRRAAAPAGPDDGTAAVLLRLSQRNQALLHRQLAVLDKLERHESDAGDLAALFRADHLAIQIRRNVEKAILLSGQEPGRRWRRPVPAIDVARAAATSVERYVAVMVASVDSAALTGPVVGDITHLLAELIDNATRPGLGDSTVWVTGELGLTAYTFVVQDRRPSMMADELAAARDALARPYRPGDPATAGLRLAGRLARTHGIEVELDQAPRGGVVARVRIPLALTVLAEDADDRPPAGDPQDTPQPGSGRLPMRSAGSVPPAGSGWRDTHQQQGRPTVDRTARFRDRLATRAPARPADGGPFADGHDIKQTLEIPPYGDPPSQHSTVDNNVPIVGGPP